MVQDARGLYNRRMSAALTKFRKLNSTLLQEHNKAKKEATELFSNARLIGVLDYVQLFLEQLLHFIEEDLQTYKNQNDRKFSIENIITVGALCASVLVKSMPYGVVFQGLSSGIIAFLQGRKIKDAFSSK